MAQRSRGQVADEIFELEFMWFAKMKCQFVCACCVSMIVFAAGIAPTVEPPKPDVLFISIDDLDDWIGCLGGHPQARTPNIDRVAHYSRTHIVRRLRAIPRARQ